MQLIADDRGSDGAGRDSAKSISRWGRAFAQRASGADVDAARGPHAIPIAKAQAKTTCTPASFSTAPPEVKLLGGCCAA